MSPKQSKRRMKLKNKSLESKQTLSYFISFKKTLLIPKGNSRRFVSKTEFSTEQTCSQRREGHRSEAVLLADLQDSRNDVFNLDGIVLTHDVDDVSAGELPT